MMLTNLSDTLQIAGVIATATFSVFTSDGALRGVMVVVASMNSSQCADDESDDDGCSVFVGGASTPINSDCVSLYVSRNPRL